MAKNLRKTTIRPLFFYLAVFSASVCLISTVLHYTNKFYANSLAWISWLLGIFSLIMAFFPSFDEVKSKLSALKDIRTLIFALLILFFFMTHLWNFQTAHWNQNGLFDDAAWNIYFAKKYIFSGQPFQIAFFDHGISREVIFHYYITLFFKLFGYNLLIFNASVLILGFITFLFTSLLIQRLFNNYIVTIVSAFILNFLPLHFIYSFVGQRYAAAAPLQMASLYFLYTGFKNKSPFKIVTSSILAALCVQAAIMGKQYLIGLFISLMLFLALDYKKTLTKNNRHFTGLFIIGLTISLIPLIVYTYYNPIYFAHENNLINKFVASFIKNSSKGMSSYIDRMLLVFFDNTYYRWFIPDFLPIPIFYYIFLLPGFFLSFLKKRYEIILLALIPVVGSFVAGASDYRMLHAAPLWVVIMAFTFNAILNIRRKKKTNLCLFSAVLWGISLVVLLSGLIPSIKYLYTKSKDPYSILFFAQKNVVVSRHLRDIVAGVQNPSTKFRHQEFNKLKSVKEPNYETLICQKLGYAVTHTFLFDYDDNKILSFCDQLPYNLLKPDEILTANKKAIQAYKKSNKDLKLIWEMTDKTERIIVAFKNLNYFGDDQILSSQHKEKKFSFYILDIRNENIDKFKQEVKKLKI